MAAPPAGRLPDEVCRQLRGWCRDQGLVGELRAFLRARLVRLVSDGGAGVAARPPEPPLALLAADLLRHLRLWYTHAVLTAEAGLTLAGPADARLSAAEVRTVAAACGADGAAVLGRYRAGDEPLLTLLLARGQPADEAPQSPRASSELRLLQRRRRADQRTPPATQPPRDDQSSVQKREHQRYKSKLAALRQHLQQKYDMELETAKRRLDVERDSLVTGLDLERLRLQQYSNTLQALDQSINEREKRLSDGCATQPLASVGVSCSERMVHDATTQTEFTADSVHQVAVVPQTERQAVSYDLTNSKGAHVASEWFAKAASTPYTRCEPPDKRRTTADEARGGSSPITRPSVLLVPACRDKRATRPGASSGAQFTHEIIGQLERRVAELESSMSVSQSSSPDRPRPTSRAAQRTPSRPAPAPDGDSSVLHDNRSVLQPDSRALLDENVRCHVTLQRQRAALETLMDKSGDLEMQMRALQLSAMQARVLQRPAPIEQPLATCRHPLAPPPPPPPPPRPQLTLPPAADDTAALLGSTRSRLGVLSAAASQLQRQFRQHQTDRQHQEMERALGGVRRALFNEEIGASPPARPLLSSVTAAAAASGDGQATLPVRGLAPTDLAPASYKDRVEEVLRRSRRAAALGAPRFDAARQSEAPALSPQPSWCRRDAWNLDSWLGTASERDRWLGVRPPSTSRLRTLSDQSRRFSSPLDHEPAVRPLTERGAGPGRGAAPPLPARPVRDGAGAGGPTTDGMLDARLGAVSSRPAGSRLRSLLSPQSAVSACNSAGMPQPGLIERAGDSAGHSETLSNAQRGSSTDRWGGRVTLAAGTGMAAHLTLEPAAAPLTAPAAADQLRRGPAVLSGDPCHPPDPQATPLEPDVSRHAQRKPPFDLDCQSKPSIGLDGQSKPGVNLGGQWKSGVDSGGQSKSDADLGGQSKSGVYLDGQWKSDVDLDAQSKPAVDLDVQWKSTAVDLDARWKPAVNLDAQWKPTVHEGAQPKLTVDLDAQWKPDVDLDDKYKFDVNLDTQMKLAVDLDAQWKQPADLDVQSKLTEGLDAESKPDVDLDSCWKREAKLDVSDATASNDVGSAEGAASDPGKSSQDDHPADATTSVGRPVTPESSAQPPAVNLGSILKPKGRSSVVLSERTPVTVEELPSVTSRQPFEDKSHRSTRDDAAGVSSSSSSSGGSRSHRSSSGDSSHRSSRGVTASRRARRRPGGGDRSDQAERSGALLRSSLGYGVDAATAEFPLPTSEGRLVGRDAATVAGDPLASESDWLRAAAQSPARGSESDGVSPWRPSAAGRSPPEATSAVSPAPSGHISAASGGASDDDDFWS